MNYLEIQSASGIMPEKVKQSLKFRTGNFVWRVHFNIPLNPQTVNNMNLYVTTNAQVPLRTNIRYDTVHNLVEIEPLEPYAQNEPYLLHVTKNVRSKSGKKMKSDIVIQFKL